MPAGNTSTYQYYAGTGGPVAAACGVSATTRQGGQLQQLTGPAPGGSGQSRVQQFVYDATGRQTGVRIGTPADIGSANWQCTSYDTSGRISQESWPSANGAPARTVSHTYAVGGNPLVSSVSDASGTITSTVDLLGRVTSYTDALGQTTSTTYNQAGQTTVTNGPDGSVHLGYDPNSGQPTTTTVNGTLLATASYNTATGQMTGVAYGNGTNAVIGYDAYGRENSLGYATTAGAITSDSVTYSLAGRDASETASQGTGTASISYGYDGAGRLTSAADTLNGATTTSTYSYATSTSCSDTAAGQNTNISSVTSTTGSTSQSTSYCYNTADQLVSSTSGTTTTTSYVYNERGDQTNDNGTTYTWDAADRVATATTPGGTQVTSTYDPVDRLIESSASTGGLVHYYIYAGYTTAPAAVLDSNGVQQSIIPLAGGVTATLQLSGNAWSYANLQGDTTATASNTGALTSGPVTYNSWGVLNPGQAAPANITGPDTFGAYTTAGKLTSSATGTILLGARTFNPTEARFLSVDPVEGGCANAYTYAFGDPLNDRDLTGRASCTAQGDAGEAFLDVTTTPGGDSIDVAFGFRNLSFPADGYIATMTIFNNSEPGYFLNYIPMVFSGPLAGRRDLLVAYGRDYGLENGDQLSIAVTIHAFGLTEGHLGPLPIPDPHYAIGNVETEFTVGDQGFGYSYQPDQPCL
jgi:RHS repeat-associated protein